MHRRGFITALSAGTLAMAQSGAPELAGAWQGTLAAGGASLRLTLDISKSADGVYLGALTSVDQGNSKMNLDTIKVTGSDVRLEIKAVAGTFEGKLDAQSAKLTGTWTQGAPLPLEFTRTGAATAAAAAPAKAPAKPYPFGPPFDCHVPALPVPFPGKGRLHLAYELHMTAFDDMTLQRIDILNGTTALASYEGTELNAILLRVGGSGDDKRILERGRLNLAFLWLDLPSGSAIPTQLRHRLTADGQTVDLFPTLLSTVKPLLLTSPLKGENWLAANGPGNASQHRRAAIPVAGRLAIGQRFAIDWLRIGPNRRSFDGDAKNNKSYFAYGSEVLAALDSTVVTVKDGIPENVPGNNSRAVPITRETIVGNHVVLDLGGGQFATYGHLQPGSLRVKPGDRVKAGQPLGLLGNSGNSTEPHLHFQVTDGPLPLSSEGLPFLLETWHKEQPLENERLSM
jgi:murein DD-endopeptidase MepM/ murein hydrolase activator NlpD